MSTRYSILELRSNQP